MGVLGLWEILESVGHPVKVEGLEGKVLGVDANIWLYKFIRGFREKDNATNIESHKLGLFNRISKLLYYRIKPVFVFDGPAPVLKRRTLERRQNVRNKTLIKVQDAAMKALANQLKSQYPDAKIDDLRITLPELRSNNLVAAEKLGEEDFNLFYLPPETKKKEESDDDSYTDDEIESTIKNSTQVDIDSKDFEQLPPEIRYEILQDIKAKRRRIRNVALPEDSASFSNLQLERLKARRCVQEKIEQCEKEICTNYTGELADGKTIQAFRVQSDETSTILYRNNTYDPKALDKLKQEKDEALVSQPLLSGEKPGTSSQFPATRSIQPEVSVSETKTKKAKIEVDELGDSSLSDTRSERSFQDVLSATNLNSTHSLPNTSLDSNQNESVVIINQIPAPELIKDEDLTCSSSSESIHSEVILIPSNQKNKQDESVIILDPTPEKSVTTSSNRINNIGQISPVLLSPISTSPPPTKESIPHEFSTLSVQRPKNIETSEVDDNPKAVPSERYDRLLTIPDSARSLPIREDSKSADDTNLKSTGEPYLISSDQQIRRNPNGSDPVVRAHSPREDHRPIIIESSQMTSQSEHVANAQRATNKVTSKIIDDAKELLRLFGIPYIDAAGEAEAQCAKLEELKLTMGTITDDSDIWLFGSQNVYRYFFSDDKYVMQYKMPDIEYHIRMNRENLVCFAMLVGSDYTDGIMNVGPVTALEILSEFPGDGMKPLVKFSEWHQGALKDKKLIGEKKRKKLLKFDIPDEFPSRAVYEGYMKPMADSTEEKFTWGTPELDELREYARRNFGWDQKKADEKLLPVMKKLNEKIQKTIDTFFFKTQANRNPEMFRSKRVNQALNKIAKRAALAPEVVNLSEDDDDDDDDHHHSKS